ncbi:NAD(P)/FAD-dependent oxidoreductase [Hymenobacter taeanensis]|uniref:NAD(P)/FAD-dependent oxidoreductase n=1 Tax=Hymenobacter taeanensis TaxID=2735321 RepID=A0A6M6BCB6_9BACT|nr:MULTISPECIES: NAD(P)/FAD-dependent oxidoreductase [Hymenobacter]QJX45580.1 NAD(P)/FAD-dependent oxidoreductase [Hymenobacter taeanensis]UOQ81171.1 NAD(P)/FAD-dependent oxidoreductase [Hymenobacter sp. 5414T-23]
MNKLDVIIVGGSYAGLSAAMLLGRSMRQVLVIDNQRPCNRQTPHSHSYLTRDGETPAAVASIAREQVAQYPTVSFLTDTVISAEPYEEEFQVQTQSGKTFSSRKLLLATGVIDELAPIPGVAECWGISVLHCPFCHGYEVRGQRLGLLANGGNAADLVTLIRNWSERLIIFTNGPADFTPEQLAIIAQHQVPVVETPIAALEHTAGYVTAVHTADKQQHPLEAIFARFPTRLASSLPEQLGCKLTETGHIAVSEFGDTSVPGLYAAGDATTPMRQVAVAVANGAKAGAAIVKELIVQGLYADLQEVEPVNN